MKLTFTGGRANRYFHLIINGLSGFKKVLHMLFSLRIFIANIKTWKKTYSWG
jgi:hypothetical protein